MPYQVSYTSEHVVELRLTGQLSASELEAAAREAMALGHAKATGHYLADLTELTGGHDVFDLYRLLELYDLEGLERRTFREAVLFSTPLPDDRLRYYETACHNRGYAVRLFSQRAAALAWLTRASGPDGGSLPTGTR